MFYLNKISAKNLKQCKLDDNACIIEVANEIFKNRYQGIGELGLSSIDPLKIDKMDLVQGGNVPVQIDLKFRKVVLLGLSKAKLYKISGFRADPENNKLEIRFKTPLGTLVGPYVINGKMLILPIRGNGNVTLNLENLDIHLKFLTKKVMKDGKAFMKIEKSKFYYEVSGYDDRWSLNKKIDSCFFQSKHKLHQPFQWGQDIG